MRVLVNGTVLHVVDRGRTDDALVFLHYFGGSARAWSAVIDRLTDDYRCVAPDLRGFGSSTASAEGYDVENQATDVIDLASALHIDRYTLVGHSMGGKIALAVAARAPAGLASLVLVAPSPPTAEPIADADRQQLIDSHGDHDAARDTARLITARPLDRAELAQVIDDNVRSSREAWRAWLERGSREDISATMPAVRVPTLVVGGANDQNIPVALLANEVVARIAGARLTVIPAVGHLIPLEAPDALSHLIRAHLRDSSALHQGQTRAT